MSKRNIHLSLNRLCFFYPLLDTYQSSNSIEVVVYHCNMKWCIPGLFFLNAHVHLIFLNKRWWYIWNTIERERERWADRRILRSVSLLIVATSPAKEASNNCHANSWSIPGFVFVTVQFGSDKILIVVSEKCQRCNISLCIKLPVSCFLFFCLLLISISISGYQAQV